MIEETLCPECNAKMVSRINKQTGQRFWGCSNYPNCRGTRDTDGNSKQDREKETITKDDIGVLPSEFFFEKRKK